jgi:hypothetical protein
VGILPELRIARSAQTIGLDISRQNHTITEMSIELKFKELINDLKRHNVQNIQRFLKRADIHHVPEQFRDAFGFWKSLSGRSRNLMLDNALGRRLKKQF